MGGGKSGGSKTQTTTSTPWAGVQPYLTDYLKRGQSVSNRPYNFYNGDTVAGFSPEQEAGFSLATQRALAGSPTLNAANTNITNTLSGNYMSPDSNPWLRDNVNTAMDMVQNRVNSQFSGDNFGSSANQELLTRNLGQVASGMYGQNYDAERGRQLQAATLSPSLAASDYYDANQLSNVGAQRQGLSQQYLNAASGQFNNAANWPYQQLDRYGQVVGIGSGAGGGSVTSPNPNQSNPYANAIGLGLTGYGLGSQGALGSITGPWGAAIGAGLGLLL